MYSVNHCWTYLFIMNFMLICITVADYCTHNEQCHSDAVCVNSECVCNGGFTGNGTHCTGMTDLVGETTCWLM